MRYCAIRLPRARAEHQVFSTGFLHRGFYRGHKTGKLLTDCSHGKARYGPLLQPFANASGILFWVSNNVLQEEKEREVFKEMDLFFFIGKECLS